MPRAVTVWFIYLDNNRLFVRTSNRTHWCRNLKANPKVNVKVEEGLAFSAEAEQVQDEELIRSLSKSYRSKYHISDIFANLFMLRKDAVFFELKI